VARGLLDDPALSRSMLLPFGKRTYQDYDDDVSEYDRTEFALPSAIADPLGRGGLLAKQALTGQRMNPDDMTRVMLDAGMLSTPVGLLGGVPKGAVLGANVFQGGPHKYGPEGAADSLKHMSKGEGAQAYGWGRYDAENKAVGQEYFDNLGGNAVVRDGKTEDRAAYLALLQDKIMDGTKASREDAYQAAKDVVDQNLSVGDVEGMDLEIVYRKAIELNDATQSQGYLYKHDLPDEDIARYLDWDAPLSEQPEIVKALESIIESTSKSFPEIKNNPNVTGQGLYNAYKSHRGGSGEEASKAFGKAGIPGLKYFDGMSRGINRTGSVEKVGDKWTATIQGPHSSTNKNFSTKPEADKWVKSKVDGTRNFVTWDQDVLNRMKLLERNGEKFDGLLTR